MDRSKLLSGVKTIVVKVGTSSITENLVLSDRKVGKIVEEITRLIAGGKSVIIVSSGAIGAGISKLGLKQRPRDLNSLQACAAVGQNELMKAYGKHFSRHGIAVAQLLLTREDFRDRGRYLNIRNTILELLRKKVVPIINENDTVAVEEIKFGDNDTLSALVASNLCADLLVLLSSMDGLHDKDPRLYTEARRISVVDDLSAVDGIHGKSNSGGVGGIDSKINAARIVVDSGIPMVIVDSQAKDILRKAAAGEDVGTLFVPKDRLDSRLCWMLFSAECRGAIAVDDGAKKALIEKNVSLLASGVIAVRGVFDKGDTVRITDDRDAEFARGITNYGKAEVEQIKGRHSAEIEKILGGRSYKEVVYRGNMVLTNDE